MKTVIPAELGGQRCDLVVARLGDMSRASARALIESGGVMVAGVAVATPRQLVTAGDTLEFTAVPEAPGLEPQEVPFGVVYEDPHLAVVDKPAGVVTHPGAGETGPTLAAGILHRWPAVRGVGATDRWGIVHRLDRDTSGLLVIALDDDTERGLREAIRLHRVEREYLALVQGAPGAPTGTIEAPIARDPARPTRMRLDPGGRPAVTHYRVEQSFATTTLLRVTLGTGRTHQIRVHLAGIELPVIGDRVYGRGSGSPRIFLHATRLSFEHPITGERIVAESPLPTDLSEVLAAQR